MHWALNTDAPVPLDGLQAALEKAQAEFLSTNTPTLREPGPNNTVNVVVDKPVLEAMLARMRAGIEAAVVLATARGSAHPFHATVHGSYTPGAGEMPGVQRRRNGGRLHRADRREAPSRPSLAAHRTCPACFGRFASDNSPARQEEVILTDAQPPRAYPDRRPGARHDDE